MARLATSALVFLIALLAGLVTTEADSAADNTDIAIYHPSAVKGQTIELEILAPAQARKMDFYMGSQESLTDTEPPFRFVIPTADLDTKKYRWTSSATGTGCCDGQNNGGSIQIYPLPKVRTFKASALVVAGTARVTGLVLSRVVRSRVVRAWGISRAGAGSGYFSLPLKLRRKQGHKRIYRFPQGFSLNVGKKTEIDIEVAPSRRVMRHGVEVRGRLLRLLLTRNRRTGATHAHRSPANICTTAAARKAENSDSLAFPAWQSCTKAPSAPVVPIICAKLEACERGIAPVARQASLDPGPRR